MIWYDKESLADTDNNTVVQKQLFGPFAGDVQREEAVAALRVVACKLSAC
jgi:hypothetical protein